MEKLISLFENVYFEALFVVLTTLLQASWILSLVLTGLSEFRWYAPEVLPIVLMRFCGYLLTTLCILRVFYSLCRKDVGDFTPRKILYVAIFW